MASSICIACQPAGTAVHLLRVHPAGLPSRTYSTGPSLDFIASYFKTKRLLWGLIGLNAVGFGLWQYSRLPISQKKQLFAISDMRFQTSRFDTLQWMVANATNSLQNFREGRHWTLLTNAFSHIELYHIIGNMVGLYAFGSVFAVLPGSRPMIATIVMGSAISASGADLVHKIMANRPDRPSLGASGVVMGLGTAAAAVSPYKTILLMGIVPLPMWILLPSYIAWNYYRLSDKRSNVGHAAHLGGAAFGALFYLSVMRARFGGVLPRKLF